MAVNLAWFKKDLRLHDHRPLVQAAEAGNVLCLYIYEPIIVEHIEYDASRLVFTNQCLQELDDALKARGSHLTLRVGAAVDVLQELHERVGIAQIWSHEETGSGRTYERDLAVAAWARAQNIPWTEIPQTGVIRRLKSRDGWAARWNKRMREPLTEPPSSIPVDRALDLDPGALQHPADLGLPESTKPEALPGGESAALAMLDSFLETRGVNYRNDMSSPVTAWEGCSRLSPYLATGAISMRLVWQRTRARIKEVRELRKAGEDIDARWAKSLSSFNSRLH